MDKRVAAFGVFSELVDSLKRDDCMSPGAGADVVESARSLMAESYSQGIADERKRCMEWAAWFRQHGEGDARVIINAIRGGGSVSDEGDDD